MLLNLLRWRGWVVRWGVVIVRWWSGLCGEETEGGVEVALLLGVGPEGPEETGEEGCVADLAV